MGTLLLSGGRRLDTNGSDLSKHFSFNRLGPPSPHSLLWELCSVYWICWIFSLPFDEQKALKERRGNSNHFQIWVLYGEPEWILEFRSDFECYQFTHSVEQKGFDPSTWEIILILIPSRAWLTCILWLQSFVRREMWKDRPSQSVQDITRGHWSDDIGFHHWVVSTLLSYDALAKTLFCTYQSVSLEIVMFVESSSSKFCILPKLWIGMHLMHRLADHYQIPILLSNSSGWKSIRMIMGKGHLCWNRTEAQLDFCTLNFSTKKPLFLGQDICLNRPYIGFVWLKGNPQYKRKMEASQNNGIKGAKTAN